MGITTDDFFENIYSVIFSPKEFFEREDITTSTRLALCTIAFVAAISKIAIGVFNGEIKNFFFIFSIIGAVIGTIIIWFLTALFFEYIAKIFDRGGNLEKLLYFTAFVPIPYIFFAPLNLVKQVGSIGYFFSTTLEFLLYFWIIFLYASALRNTYKISLSRSFMLIFLPFIASFFACYWLVGFFQKMWYIFSI